MRVRSGSKFLVVIPIPHPPCSTSRLRASVSGSFYCSPWVEGICSSWTGDGYHFQSLSFDGINLTWDFPCWLIVKLCHLVLVLRGYENWSSITQDKWIRTNYRYMQHELLGNYAKWKNSIPRKWYWVDSIYITSLKWQNHRSREQISSS